jgi:hypothetical protein
MSCERKTGIICAGLSEDYGISSWFDITDSCKCSKYPVGPKSGGDMRFGLRFEIVKMKCVND